MKTKKLLMLLMLTSATVFNACKKPKDGEPGPQGPKGNANVSAYTVTTTNSSWNLYADEWDAVLNVPAITSSVVSGGTVQVFGGDGSGTTWQALPFSFNIIQFNYSYEVGKVTIMVTYSDGTVPINPGGQQFKIVVIPPAAMVKYPNVNFKNYEAIKTAFNLSE